MDDQLTLNRGHVMELCDEILKRNIISGDVNYYGFSKGFGFGHGRGGILKTIFEWEGSVKPVSSIFMGLSPELEFALYTLGVLLMLLFVFKFFHRNCTACQAI